MCFGEFSEYIFFCQSLINIFPECGSDVLLSSLILFVHCINYCTHIFHLKRIQRLNWVKHYSVSFIKTSHSSMHGWVAAIMRGTASNTVRVN